ncbi:hypothetical protein F5Y10DRAFT_266920 [Nemania abortiva]|nr:hypothetical protein F5Y10DRAFT_266920 [Nemania abortiva]
MLKPNTTIALVVTLLILSAFTAFCVLVHRLRDPGHGSGYDSDDESMYGVSTSTSASTSLGDIDVAAAAAAEAEQPVRFPPGVRVSPRGVGDSPASEPRGGNEGGNESNSGSGSGGGGGNGDEGGGGSGDGNGNGNESGSRNASGAVTDSGGTSQGAVDVEQPSDRG